jgi:hypothetical protein
MYRTPSRPGRRGDGDHRPGGWRGVALAFGGDHQPVIPAARTWHWHSAAITSRLSGGQNAALAFSGDHQPGGPAAQAGRLR